MVEAGIRLSLAGAQDKIAVRLEGETIYLPLNGSVISLQKQKELAQARAPLQPEIRSRNGMRG